MESYFSLTSLFNVSIALVIRAEAPSCVSANNMACLPCSTMSSWIAFNPKPKPTTNAPPINQGATAVAKAAKLPTKPVLPAPIAEPVTTAEVDTSSISSAAFFAAIPPNADVNLPVTSIIPDNAFDTGEIAVTNNPLLTIKFWVPSSNDVNQSTARVKVSINSENTGTNFSPIAWNASIALFFNSNSPPLLTSSKFLFMASTVPFKPSISFSAPKIALATTSPQSSHIEPNVSIPTKFLFTGSSILINASATSCIDFLALSPPLAIPDCTSLTFKPRDLIASEVASGISLNLIPASLIASANLSVLNTPFFIPVSKIV